MTRCYSDLAHRPHFWNVIGERWWCDGLLLDWRSWRRWAS